MEKIKVLIADDESRMRKLVNDFLSRNNYDVIEAFDGQDAIEKFYNDKDISLIILDVMMPRMDGWQALQEIRKDSNIPVIMLTAKSEEKDELDSFDLGADEYISKPFSPKVLTARVDALLRRSYNIDSNEIVDVGGIIINNSAHTVSIDNEEIELSFKEFELLNYFVENKGIALSREKILNNVWNYDYFGDARTIDTHVKSFAKSLEAKEIILKQFGVWATNLKLQDKSYLFYM